MIHPEAGELSREVINVHRFRREFESLRRWPGFMRSAASEGRSSLGATLG